jgi:hypothetical protein
MRRPRREIFVRRSCLAYFLTKFSSVRPVPQVALWPPPPAGAPLSERRPDPMPAVTNRHARYKGRNQALTIKSPQTRPADTLRLLKPCRKPEVCLPWTCTSAGAGIRATTTTNESYFAQKHLILLEKFTRGCDQVLPPPDADSRARRTARSATNGRIRRVVQPPTSTRRDWPYPASRIRAVPRGPPAPGLLSISN